MMPRWLSILWPTDRAACSSIPSPKIAQAKVDLQHASARLRGAALDSVDNAEYGRARAEEVTRRVRSIEDRVRNRTVEGQEESDKQASDVRLVAQETLARLDHLDSLRGKSS